MDREQLVEAMAEAMAEMSGILVWASINDWAQGIWLKRARAALAVAEPAVRADEREKLLNRFEGECCGMLARADLQVRRCKEDMHTSEQNHQEGRWHAANDMLDFIERERTGGTP